jgi:hypothetical protein
MTTNNARYLPRFQALCEAHGLRPTYLVNNEMVCCRNFCEFGCTVLRRDTAEIGMHLHAWDSPPIVPLTEDDCAHHPYAFEYPCTILRDKVARLTDVLEDTFGVKMLSHRAGRWGLDARYAELLAEKGYRVDCSVMPHTSFRQYPGDPTGDGGPDFTDSPETAYFLDRQDVCRQGDLPLLEVPMTVLGHPFRGARWLHALVGNAPRLLRAPVNRLFPPRVRLQPNGRNLRYLLRVLKCALEERRDYVQFTLHSSELMPGGSPLFRTERSIEKLYRDLERLFDAARTTFRGATLSEYYQHFTASARKLVHKS